MSFEMPPKAISKLISWKSFILIKQNFRFTNIFIYNKPPKSTIPLIPQTNSKKWHIIINIQNIKRQIYPNKNNTKKSKSNSPNQKSIYLFVYYSLSLKLKSKPNFVDLIFITKNMTKRLGSSSFSSTSLKILNFSSHFSKSVLLYNAQIICLNLAKAAS